ncbi:MAG: prolyl oligopeptidase family serine peptidase, partial [Caulobacteraceae bacterium]
MHLSDGGSDAVELREFDTREAAFVPGGFHFATGKQDAAWIGPDVLLVGRNWGPGTLTTSGYPYIVKEVRRGEPPSQARTIFQGERTDVRVFPRVLRDRAGKVREVLIGRSPSFFETRWFELTPDGRTRSLDIPLKNRLVGWLDGRIILQINEEWLAGPQRGAIPAGDLVAFDPKTGSVEVVYQPPYAEALDDARITADGVLVSYLHDVDGRMALFSPENGVWRRRELDLPARSGLAIRAADPFSSRAFVTAESFLEPSSLWEIDAASGKTDKIKAIPPQFDASKDVLEQHFARSKDGTRIPYYLVRPRTMKFDGSTPVEMFGYGGFQISVTPAYKPQLGKLWLERGGAYVSANIRGGGEYGPAWHEAAMGPNRQRAFDDFAAVAEDLVHRGITSP